MKKIIITLAIALLASSAQYAQKTDKITISSDIELYKLSDNVYVHVSYFSFPKFGRFPSNGLVFVNNREAFLMDTPPNDSLTAILYKWLTDSMHLSVKGFIPNHWHGDCMGGLTFLKSKGITSYANAKTIAIAKTRGLPVPDREFTDSWIIPFGKTSIQCFYMGAGHSTDNIAVWLPDQKVLFAGCMVKEMSSKNLGNLEDADITAWPATLQKLKKKFPSVRTVVPGHGACGGMELIDHTLSLFK